MGKGKSRQPAAKPEGIRKNANLEFILEQAIALLKQGQLVAAEVYFRQLLAADPRHLDALQLLGVIEYQKGRFELAAELLQLAVNMAPDEPGLLCNLGLALQQLGRSEQALACLERALVLKPDSVEALNNRGNVLRELKRMDEAAASYQQALRHRPGFVEALHNLGLTHIALQQPELALACLARCLRIDPRHLGASGQYGVALLALKRPREALDYFLRVVKSSPNDAEAHYWSGNALLGMDRPEEALASYLRAAHINPDIPEIQYNLACVLVDLERQEESLAAFERALELRPDYVQALYNLGGALQDLRRHEEAASTYERLLSIAPDHRYTLGQLINCRRYGCDWAHYTEYVEDLDRSMQEGNPRDMPFSYLSVSGDPARQRRCAQAFTARHYPSSPRPLWAGQHYRHDRLRVAYVSGDFRDHALCYLLAGVFEAHERQRFETFALSLRPPEASAMGKRVAAAFEHFVDVSKLSDREVAARMHELEVDIAVDLMRYTENNRTGIFAERPAPIQVNYLGYPGTMGAGYIDYIIADEFVIPENYRQHYSEHVVWLPECFQGNDERRVIAGHAPSRAESGLPDSGFVFCAFNNSHKLTPAFFDIWMRLLIRVPESVLWLVSNDVEVERNLIAEAEKRGVAPQRLVFSPRIAYAEHLARLRLADLFLDTLPFNAGTTASDALWAGVPVLTCAGEAFAARMAGSLLQALGLPELITHSLEDYEALALKLATTPTQMTAIRARLADRRLNSPLFDTARFCRHLEAAYLGMWERQQSGRPPMTFSVAPLEAAIAPHSSLLQHETDVSSLPVLEG